jgi:ribonuclease BN (tRNA processing enzyme)
VRTRHPVETYAVRAEAQGRVLVYTADTGPSDDVTALARGADLLVAEASLQAPADGMEDVHMTAAEAGEMAAAAGAGHLLLTHIPPYLDAQRSLAQARERYGGGISLASDGLLLRV